MKKNHKGLIKDKMIKYQNTFWDYCKKGLLYLVVPAAIGLGLLSLLPSSNILSKKLGLEKKIMKEYSSISFDENSSLQEETKTSPKKNPIIINLSNSNNSSLNLYFGEKAIKNNIPLSISVDTNKDLIRLNEIVKNKEDIDLCFEFSNKQLQNDPVYFSDLQTKTALNLQKKLTTAIDLTKNEQEIDLMNLRQAGIKIIFDDNLQNEGYRIEPYKIVRLKKDADIKVTRNINLEKIIKSVNNETKLDPVVLDFELSNSSNKEIDKLVSQLVSLRDSGYNFISPKDFYYDYLGLPQYIILRLDDYQTPFGKEIFEKTVTKLSELNVPQTIAAIPSVGRRLSEDKKAKKFLESMYKKGLIEIAMHGFNGDSYEFLQKYDAQKNMMLNSFEEFDKITKQDISTVIITTSRKNEYTSKIIRDLNKNNNKKINIISSTFSKDEYIFGFDKDNVYHISRTIDIVKDWSAPLYPLKSLDEIINLVGSDDAVINIHPFRNETQEKQEHVIDLVKKLKENKNIKFVTTKEFYEENTKPLGVYQDIAESAWNFFEQNLNEKTGLYYDGIYVTNNQITSRYNITTNWDLGSAIFAIVSADKLSLISNKEAETRLNKIFEFLKTNSLYDKKFPNNYYNTESLEMEKEGMGTTGSDLGRLLLSLKLVEKNYTNLKSACDSIVNRWEIPVYDEIIYGIDKKGRNEETNCYTPYFSNGFTEWGYKTNNSNRLLFVPYVNKYNSAVYIPKMKKTNKLIDFILTSEPYILTGIEVGYNKDYKKMANLVYEAQKKRYLIKGIPTSLSEGSIDKSPWFMFSGITNDRGEDWPVSRHIGGKTKNYSDLRSFNSKAAIAWDVLQDDAYSNMLRRIVKNNNVIPGFGVTNGIYEKDWKENKVMELNTNAIILEAIAYKLQGKPLLQTNP